MKLPCAPNVGPSHSEPMVETPPSVVSKTLTEAVAKKGKESKQRVKKEKPSDKPNEPTGTSAKG